MAGDRSPGYYIRWENGSRSFGRIGTVLKGSIASSEEPEPSPNGDKDDGQEPGLEGGTDNGDGPD